MLAEFLISSKDVFVIAEIGINHSGKESEARKLIEASRIAGVNAVKFQYRNLNRAYSLNSNEIGDEIVKSEVIRNYLSPEKILNLTKFAHDLGLMVGISFFIPEDVSDFGEQIDNFDFFKVPSVELNNIHLISTLLNHNKYVLISTGAHSEEELNFTIKALPVGGWSLMHCISNYPTRAFNANLGYIDHMRKISSAPVGYSSHDQDWAVIAVALTKGVRIIERHITLDSKLEGLDHSTSSTPDEFEALMRIVRNFPLMLEGDGPRTPNQGERMNRQNLGRSFYSREVIRAGQSINVKDLDYRAPMTGLSIVELSKLDSSILIRDLLPGEPLARNHFIPLAQIRDSTIEFAKNNLISLPVRLHDYSEISSKFPIGNFELHLSFEEVFALTDLDFMSFNDQFSIHLPDYCDPTHLLDPFATDQIQREKSLRLLEKIEKVASKAQRERGHTIPIVGSFSSQAEAPDFLGNHLDLVARFSKQGLKLLFQWLPPFAWYFGGSHSVGFFNNRKHIELLEKAGQEICLDISHFIMGAKYFEMDLVEDLNRLVQLSPHFHISDAVGVDGEGLQFGMGPKENMDVLDCVMQQPFVKVIEVWQGHLNDYAGFNQALDFLEKRYG